MMKSLHNGMDVIDSRDVIARIDNLTDQLTAEFDDWKNEQDEADSTDHLGVSFDAWVSKTADDGDDDAQELLHLRELASDLDGVSDWVHGVTLIRDGHFVEYAKEFAEDIGAIDKRANWPLNHIDWDAAADALKQDYSSAEFDGVTYWAQS